MGIGPGGAEHLRVEPGRPIPGERRQMRILVADDNRDAAETLAGLLRLWGHEARVAYDGPSAVEAALHFKPHVVLLDIQMPEMHGGDVAVNLRREGCLCDTRIVATSACEPDDRRLARYEGVFDGYLGKPCDFEELGRLLAAGRGPLQAAGSQESGEGARAS